MELDEYKGVPYIVTRAPLGNLTAYIRIPDDHPWNGLVDKTRDIPGHTLNVGYNDIPLDVHGGPTFSARVKGDAWPQGFTDGAWVGWDYAH